MKPEPILHEPSLETLSRMPGWVALRRAETPEDAAFLSGAALAHLHLALSAETTPGALLRDRLALRAAAACAAFAGRPERAGELRDAAHLLRLGDLPGPAGEIYLSWRRAVARPASPGALARALPGEDERRIAIWLDAGRAEAPVARASSVLETVLAERPRAEAAGLILADAALAQALGWARPAPLLVNGLKRADLRKRGDDLRVACHRAATLAAAEALRLAADLARRAARLNAVAPKLRAKGAAAAVEIFLTRDAAAPAALLLPDRAARRLCDRLVDLGAVRELTGRDTFRLYGV
ncbi:DUF1403 family protein [Roseovarius spongiae]|uniref:DUF1403 family protein n=1 Tax=Roseovarius spongiae TaxID=2320272 RepID=A0A3A8ARC0_9RHOB|nr:DUF1403 family protein [Roseovarius spongiae]RKF12405.1 DUF1403 family protein [Roseovarius spongiae]